RALNVRGAGVQVRRNRCFEKACQALWPGDDPIDEWTAAGFSAEDVAAVSEARGGGGWRVGAHYGGMNFENDCVTFLEI
ncbi:unnamed protein product, partial [Pylaiella littoralis]